MFCVSVLFLSDYVFAEGENEIKKGHYPFMVSAQSISVLFLYLIVSIAK